MPLSIDLSGKTALVTGATGQLGRDMVRTFAVCGADVGIHCRHNRKQAEILLADIRALGVNGCIVQGDVGQLNDMMAIRDTMASQLSPPNIVVTNAVTQIYPWKSVLEEDIRDYTNQFHSCVLHNVLAAKAFVPHMISTGWGRFIGINTEVSLLPHQKQSAYASGKKGMDGVLQVLAREVGPSGVTVNQVAPGWIEGFRDRPQDDAVHQAYATRVPLRRRGTPAEIANVVAFLASDLASFITGAFIPVNGGNTFTAI